MNNACPSCGAVYAVSAKDIGRKLKCKKCSSALVVADAGLVFDAPVESSPPPLPAAAVAIVAEEDEDFDTDDEVVASKKGKKGKKASGGRGGPDFGAILAKLGGISTMLFGLGVFLVIWFTFMAKIGEAAILRAEAYSTKLEAEKESKIKALLKGKAPPTNPDEFKKFTDDSTKITEEYVPKLVEAAEDTKATRIKNIRDIWFDRWGEMFGFLFVAFGCIGYLRTEQPLIMRIVAAVILTFMMMVVFISFGGCGGDKVPSLPSTKGGAG